MKKLRYIIYIQLLAVIILIVSACSSTSAIPDGEQLFTGLKPIKYENYEKCAHADETMEEMEYVLASAPNGALFGSSYYRSPFPIRLWIWNAFVKDSSDFSQWMVRAFGSQPKYLSQVNPTLRVKVAQNQLKKYGYFNSKVTFDEVQMSNPKKAKIAYNVNLGHLWTIDTVKYLNFPSVADSLLDEYKTAALVKSGDPFKVSKLESERQRITTLFRDNGYYYYDNSYASYLADTINNPGKVKLHFQMADSIDQKALHKWYLGKISINFRKNIREQLNDSSIRRNFSLYYNGKRPIRMGALRRDFKMRKGQLYSSSEELLAKKNLQGTGLYSYINMTYTPRNISDLCDTLDLALDLVFDKPYDFYVEANGKGKTTGYMGPEFVVGFTKRNAFRGGEKLDINLHGSYEWQITNRSSGASSSIDSYEYGGDASLTFPRIITPMTLLQTKDRDRRRRRNGKRYQYFGTPTTTIKGSMNVLNRAKYYRRHVVSGELTYDWWTSAQSHFSFSPLVLSYEYMNQRTALFEEKLEKVPYLKAAMDDRLVPKMSFTYAYSSPASYKNPISWETTVSEAANLISLGFLACGKEWTPDSANIKKLFKNKYSQFLKLQTDFVKKWTLNDRSSIVGHLNAGIIWGYGNSKAAPTPYFEQFFVGGANSVRAFAARSIGPGRFEPNDSTSFLEQNGDIKFLANLEYRQKLFGDLYGAIFLDAGNVWRMPGTNGATDENVFKFKDFYRQMAVGTGLGVRYDLGMFVIRIDWGLGLHVPYHTEKKGFYNIPKFKDSHSLHLAVGYPF